MVSAPGRRCEVAYAKTRGLSKRRACALFEVARSGLEHESVRDRQDAPVIAKMRELAAQYLTCPGLLDHAFRGS
jgi:putative transposase